MIAPNLFIKRLLFQEHLLNFYRPVNILFIFLTLVTLIGCQSNPHLPSNSIKSVQLPDPDYHKTSLNGKNIAMGNIPAPKKFQFSGFCQIAKAELADGAYQYPDLMYRIRSELNLPYPQNRRVKNQLKWYARHPAYLKRTFKRGAPYLYLITEEVNKRKLPMELALLPIVESAFDPFAYSRGRASGIWQFVPWTGKRYGMKLNWWYDGRRDIGASTVGALNYLERLYRMFNKDWMLALAAYNSGEGNVLKAIKKNRRRHRSTDFWSLNLPKETKAYVPKLLALSELVRHPHKYNLKFDSIPNKPFLEKIGISSQIDLGLAANMAELDIKDIYKYNAAFNRWATDPNGPHYLYIPVEKAKTFRANLKKIPPAKRIKWVRYRVRTGDSLSTIAHKFRTSKKLIMSVNQLRKNVIRIGQKLMIPSSTRSLKQYTLSADSRLAKIKRRKHSGTKVTHKVVAGDNMWDISRKYHVNVRKLAKWNGMATTDKLKIGQKLNIWISKKNPMASSLRFNNGPGKTRKIHYKVRSGDSLARISQKFKVAMKDLLKWNRLNPKKYLQPGQSLMLMVDVTEQSGY